MTAKLRAIAIVECKLAVRRCKLANLLIPLPHVLHAPNTIHPTPTKVLMKLFIVI